MSTTKTKIRYLFSCNKFNHFLPVCLDDDFLFNTYCGIRIKNASSFKQELIVCWQIIRFLDGIYNNILPAHVVSDQAELVVHAHS